MASYRQAFLVKSGANIRLRQIDPNLETENRAEAEAATGRAIKRLRRLQELLYAEHKRSLLICLQGMDASGKDGVIRHVLGLMNPQGCRVYPFKAPVGVERDHDFMWRAYRDLPAVGEVAIFNRSHYEDVLVSRVHRLVPKKIIEQRYGEINAIE